MAKCLHNAIKITNFATENYEYLFFHVMKQKNNEQVINWIKAALKRQQDWQQEVRERWAVKQQTIATV